MAGGPVQHVSAANIESAEEEAVINNRAEPEQAPLPPLDPLSPDPTRKHSIPASFVLAPTRDAPTGADSFRWFGLDLPCYLRGGNHGIAPVACLQAHSMSLCPVSLSLLRPVSWRYSRLLLIPEKLQTSPISLGLSWL